MYSEDSVWGDGGGTCARDEVARETAVFGDCFVVHDVLASAFSFVMALVKFRLRSYAGSKNGDEVFCK
jgi:hypothetical protein